MTKSRRMIMGAAALSPFTSVIKPAHAAAPKPDKGAIDVMTFGAIGNGVNDDSAAIVAACQRAMEQFTAGQSCYLRFPSGQFYINSKKIPVFSAPIGVAGAGSHQTILRIGPDYSGDVFSWSNCWSRASYGKTTIESQVYAGAFVQDIGIVGNLSSAHTQNGLAFYNINDFIRINNVVFAYIPGRAIYCGESNDKDGYGIMRESRFNEIRIFQCGTKLMPCVEVSSCGNSDGTNELIFAEVDIFYPGGHGFVIRNNGVEPVRLIKIFGLRIEKVGSGFNGLQIGCLENDGAVYGVNVAGLELVACEAGSTALAILGIDENQVTSCAFQGQIVNCRGNGIVVMTGAYNKVSLMLNASKTGLTISHTRAPFYYDCVAHTTYSISPESKVLLSTYAPPHEQR